MRYCDLQKAQRFAASGAVDYNLEKSVLAVSNRLNRTLEDAERYIRATIGKLTPAEFVGPGRGTPYPPCDEYRFADTIYADGSWDRIEWYIKLGNTDALVFIESFHPAVYR